MLLTRPEEKKALQEGKTQPWRAAEILRPYIISMEQQVALQDNTNRMRVFPNERKLSLKERHLSERLAHL